MTIVVFDCRRRGLRFTLTYLEDHDQESGFICWVGGVLRVMNQGV